MKKLLNYRFNEVKVCIVELNLAQIAFLNMSVDALNKENVRGTCF